MWCTHWHPSVVRRLCICALSRGSRAFSGMDVTFWVYIYIYIYIYAGAPLFGWVELLDAEIILLIRFAVFAAIMASSPTITQVDIACFHEDLSPARVSQDVVSMPQAFMSLLHTSLKRRCGRPLCLAPVASSPYNRSLGILPSSILLTCPGHRSRRLWSRVCIVGRPAFFRTSLLVTLSDQGKPSIRGRQRMWKT